MGKLTVVGLAGLLIFAVALILIDTQLRVKEQEQASNGSQGQERQDSDDFQFPGFVALHVDGYLVEDSWKRGINDLPVLSVAINYVVENVGNVSADVVNIEVFLDSVHFSNKTIHNLFPNSEFKDSILLSVDYDQTKTVEVETSCENVTDSWSYTIDAELPRQLAWGVSKLFITPDEEFVQSAYREVMGGFGPIPIHWIAIREWVADSENIEYVNDYDSHSVSEFWQLGRETLQSRTGDCEDFAILLCSLLRADGWGAEEVYVVIGQNEAGEYHAWVKIKIPLVGWYNIEPRQGGWYTLFGDFVALHGFTAAYNFNDHYFIEL